MEVFGILLVLLLVGQCEFLKIDLQNQLFEDVLNLFPQWKCNMCPHAQLYVHLDFEMYVCFCYHKWLVHITHDAEPQVLEHLLMFLEDFI